MSCPRRAGGEGEGAKYSATLTYMGHGDGQIRYLLRHENLCVFKCVCVCVCVCVFVCYLFISNIVWMFILI